MVEGSGVDRVDGVVDRVDGMVNRVDGVDGVSRVDLSGVDGGGSVFGFSGVLHISDVSAVSVIYAVGHGLDTTIGQSHVVFTGSSVSIAVLRLTEVGATVVVGNGVVVSVHWGSVGVSGGGVVGVGGQSHGDEGSESQNSLKWKWLIY